MIDFIIKFICIDMIIASIFTLVYIVMQEIAISKLYKEGYDVNIICGNTLVRLLSTILQVLICAIPVYNIISFIFIVSQGYNIFYLRYKTILSLDEQDLFDDGSNM